MASLVTQPVREYFKTLHESLVIFSKFYDVDCASLPGESKKFMRLVGCGIKCMQLIFKTEMLIYQSNTNLDEAKLFSKITHHLDSEIRKMLANSKF